MIRTWLPSLLTFCIPATALLAPEPSIFKPMRHVLTVPELLIMKSVLKGVPSHLVVSTAQRESGIDPFIQPHRNENGTRDWGIMQLNDRYHPSAPSMTVEENIDEGIAALQDAVRRCGASGAAWAYVHGYCKGRR
jgi:hypothetical protein